MPGVSLLLGSQLGPSPDPSVSVVSSTPFGTATWHPARSGLCLSGFPSALLVWRRVFASTARHQNAWSLHQVAALSENHVIPFSKGFVNDFQNLFEAAASEFRTTQRICSHRLFVNPTLTSPELSFSPTYHIITN